MLRDELPAQRVEVEAADAVAPVRILHEAELLVQFDQPVEQPLRALEMDVVVARAVDDQQLALEPLGKGDRRAVL